MRLRVFKQLSQINILREEEVQDLKATVLEFFFKKKFMFPTTQQDLTQQPPLYFVESLI